MSTSVSQSDKPGLLYLCHRIPFPPDKGDKIRSYHLLRYLCRHYRVYLGCFIDDPADEKYLPEVRALCEEVLALPLNPALANVRSLTGLLYSQPLSVPFYRNATMQRWVNKVVEDQSLQRCVVFSSVMAQFVMHYPPQKLRTLVDFVDVDSDKWRQYAHTRPWPLSSLLRREARQLLHFERKVAALAHRSFLVSRAEADLFRRLVPEQDARIDFFTNGVDTVYFDPAIVCDNPYPGDVPVLVFTGAMDYWPNVDAVCWFVKEVFPALRQAQPDLYFYIVGRNPNRAVKQLTRQRGVVVTGRVEDVRPYLKHALAAVAPMRIARGIQNKVLEAMAMAKVVLASGLGLEGIDAELGGEVLLTNELRDYQEFLPDLLQQGSSYIGRQARERVIADFNWQNSLPKVGRFLEDQLAAELQHD